MAGHSKHPLSTHTQSGSRPLSGGQGVAFRGCSSVWKCSLWPCRDRRSRAKGRPGREGMRRHGERAEVTSRDGQLRTADGAGRTGLVHSRCSVSVPEEEEDSTGSLLNLRRIQGPRSVQAGRGQSPACQGKVTCHPRPILHPWPRIVPGTLLPVDVVSGPGEPDSPVVIKESGLCPWAGR